MKILSAALLIAIPQLGFACSSGPFTPEEDVPKAESVLVGYVTGNFFPAYEKSVLETGRGEEMGGQLYLRIAIVETLKGRIVKVVETQDGCFNIRPGTRVVLLRDNGVFSVHEASYDDTEARVRQALGKEG